MLERWIIISGATFRGGSVE